MAPREMTNDHVRVLVEEDLENAPSAVEETPSLIGSDTPGEAAEVDVFEDCFENEDESKSESGESGDDSSSIFSLVFFEDDDFEDNGNGDNGGDRRGDDDAANNRWGRGVVRDAKRTIGTHWGDEMTNLNSKTVGVSLFVYFAATAPAITFGSVFAKSTNNYIGVEEMLIATSWCGIVYGLLGGQPMMINGGTGPMLAFTTVLFEVSQRMEIPFLTLNAWTGLWLGFFLCVAAFVDLGFSEIIKHLTRFTMEIFTLLIAGIYIIDALGTPFNRVGVFWYFAEDHKSHLKYKDDPDYSHWATAFLSCILTFGTTYGAFYLRSMKHSRFLPNQAWRNLVCDFAIVLNIVFWTVIAKAGFKEVETETLNVPSSFSPTFVCCNSTCLTNFPHDCPYVTEPWGRRPWLVDLTDTGGKPWVPLAAAGPGMLAFSLVFLDNAITWEVVNHPSNRLTHGDAYNYDTVVIGAMIAANSMLGLPWLVAATLRSITHVHAMAERDAHTGRIAKVQETRLTHIFVHVMVLCTMLFASKALKQIPVPVLYGVFLFMGIASLSGNELWLRFKMIFMQPDRVPDEPYSKYMPHRRMHMFTLFQIFIFVLLIVFRSIPVLAIAFPINIKLSIPIRKYILPRLFSEEELVLLDGDEDVIEKLVRRFEREGHALAAVTRNSRILQPAAFDFAHEGTGV